MDLTHRHDTQSSYLVNIGADIRYQYWIGASLINRVVKERKMYTVTIVLYPSIPFNTTLKLYIPAL